MGDLQRYARAIGEESETLQRYRSVSRAHENGFGAGISLVCRHTQVGSELQHRISDAVEHAEYGFLGPVLPAIK